MTAGAAAHIEREDGLYVLRPHDDDEGNYAFITV